MRFRGGFGAVSGRFRGGFGAVTGRFRCGFGAVSGRFGAVSGRFQKGLVGRGFQKLIHIVRLTSENVKNNSFIN